MKKIFKIIISEYFDLTKDKNPLKGCIYFFFHNSFKVQCYIRFIVSMKPSLKRHIFAQILEKKYGVLIGDHVTIGRNLCVCHHEGLIIGDKSIIGNNCNIYHQVTLGQKNGQYPQIGDDVTIFPGATIVGNVSVGNHSIIGPNSVVISDISPNSVVSGIPANCIKNR